MLFSNYSAYGQYPAMPAANVQGFGVDDDVWANMFTRPSVPVPSTDDWFGNDPTPGETLPSEWNIPMAPGGLGWGVIDLTYYRDNTSEITAKIAAFEAFDFRMSVPRYTNIQAPGGTWYEWIDGVYGRDELKVGGESDATTFAMKVKNSDNPEYWDYKDGNTPPKNDLSDVFGYLRREVDPLADPEDYPVPGFPEAGGHLFAYGAAATMSSNGDSHVDFEFFRNEVTWDGNTLLNTGDDEGRSAFVFDGTGNVLEPGDLIVITDFEGGGTNPVYEVRVWMKISDMTSLNGDGFVFNDDDNHPNRPFDITGVYNQGDGCIDYGYVEIQPKGSEPADFWATVNISTTPLKAAPWGTVIEKGKVVTGYYQYQLTEIAIDMTKFGLDKELYPLAPGADPCSNLLGTLLVKSRSSASFTAQLKDFAGPYPFGNTVNFAVTMDPQQVCEGDEVTFTATVIDPSGFDDFSSAEFLYKWYWEDAPGTILQSTDNGKSDSYTIASADLNDNGRTMKVDVALKADPDCVRPGVGLLTVYANPAPSFTADNVCDGNAIVFNNASTPGTNPGTPVYSWTFGDGGTSSEFSPTHTYSVPGNYTVRLTMTQTYDDDICTNYMEQSVTVYTNPVAAFDADNDCDGEDIVFNNNSQAGTNPGTPVYSWDFGDGETSALENPTHNYSGPGTYTVRLTISQTDPEGGPVCSDYIEHPVTVYSNPTAAFNADNDCDGEAILFTNNSQAGNNPGTPVYSWDFGDGTTSSLENPEHTYSGSGTYTVGLTISQTDPEGAVCSDYIEHPVTVYSNPIAEFEAENVCDGDVIQFTNLSTAGDNPGSPVYSWDFGDGGTSTDENPSHTYAVVGTYTVSLSISQTDPNGAVCSDAISHVVDVYPIPTLNPTNGEECASHESNLTSIEICAEGSVGDTIKWYSDAGATNFLGVSKGLSEGDLTSCIFAAISQTTSYWATVTSINGCVSAPVEIVATVLPNPICDYTYGANSSNTTGDNGWASVVAYGGTGTLSYHWSTLNGIIGSNPDMQTITGLTKGLYTVRITDTKGCWTECDYEVLSAPVCSVEGSEVDCFGDTDGTVRVSWVQGTAPFDVYLLDEFDNVLMSALDVGASPHTFQNVPVGTDYYARVVDDDGLDTDCGPVDVIQPPDLECELTALTPAYCEQWNGTAEIMVRDPLVPAVPGGGTPPYTITYRDSVKENVTVAQLPFIIDGLPVGATTVTVTDARGCTTTCPVTIAGECDVCETAYGYDVSGTNYSFLDDCDPPGFWNNWGWSIAIPARSSLLPDTVYKFPMYAGAPVCDPTLYYESHIVDTAMVTYDGTTITVDLPELKAGEGYTWEQSHIWVSEEGPSDMFPDKIAPGQWPFVEGDVIPFTGGYIIVHAVYCGPKLPLVVVPKSFEIQNPTFEESSLKVYPNPFSEKVTFEFVSGKDAYGVLEIFNITGQKVARILDRPVEAGVMNRIEYEPANRVTGIYIYRLQLDNDIQVGRIIYKE